MGACKVLSLAEAAAAVDRWSGRGLRVVLTNGCFDLVHVGHVRYLAAARALGDRLVVALNDDASTRRLKGPGRPVLPADERAELLCALRAVDIVVPFDTDTAVDVVRALGPAVYVKGGDYGGPGRVPPEAAVAGELGAEVLYIPFVSGRSSSALIEQIRRPSA